ncbi:hypothetical protein FA13DRAFT_1726306, partial [Coprinellus micaceus]
MVAGSFNEGGKTEWGEGADRATPEEGEARPQHLAQRGGRGSLSRDPTTRYQL